MHNAKLEDCCRRPLRFANDALYAEIQKKIQNICPLPEEIALGKRYAQEIEEVYFPACCTKWINEKAGFGLFLEEPLNAESFIGEYTGLIRKIDSFEGLNNYLYRYPVQDDGGRHFVIDAKDFGNHTRFINHDFQPNLKCLWAFHKGLYHMLLIAKRPLSSGEQLCYNYGKNYWYVRGAPQPLQALSLNCPEFPDS
jgi:hypothetical protein